MVVKFGQQMFVFTLPLSGWNRKTHQRANIIAKIPLLQRKSFKLSFFSRSPRFFMENSGILDDFIIITIYFQYFQMTSNCF